MLICKVYTKKKATEIYSYTNYYIPGFATDRKDLGLNKEGKKVVKYEDVSETKTVVQIL